MKELPPCWVRGEIDATACAPDSLLLATVRCVHRLGQLKVFWGGERMDYGCNYRVTGPTVKYLPDGQIVSGGVDLYASFCSIVDCHLRSLGERSKLIIEGSSKDLPADKASADGLTPLLPAPDSYED